MKQLLLGLSSFALVLAIGLAVPTADSLAQEPVPCVICQVGYPAVNPEDCIEFEDIGFAGWCVVYNGDCFDPPNPC